MVEGKQLILSIRNNVLHDSLSQGTNMALLVWSGPLGHKQKEKKLAETGGRGEIKGHFEQLHLSNSPPPQM